MKNIETGTGTSLPPLPEALMSPEAAAAGWYNLTKAACCCWCSITTNAYNSISIIRDAACTIWHQLFETACVLWYNWADDPTKCEIAAEACKIWSETVKAQCAHWCQLANSMSTLWSQLATSSCKNWCEWGLAACVCWCEGSSCDISYWERKMNYTYKIFSQTIERACS